MRNRQHFAYARHALVTAFRMCGVRPGSRVLLPNFICRDVLASLHAVGASPVYYDVDGTLQIRSGQSFPQIDAALAVNYFGFAADLHQLREAIGTTPIIIEDNAHGWLSVSQDGVALGGRTPISITSFRKSIFCPDGAFLEWDSETFSTDEELAGRLLPRAEKLGFAFQVRHLARVAERTTHLPVLLGLRSTVRLARRVLGRPAIDDRPMEERDLPVHEAIHERSLRDFTRVDTDREALRRRKQFQSCARIAAKCGIIPVFSTLPTGTVPMGFPYLHGHGNERWFTSQIHLRRLGEIITWPALPSSTSLEPTSPLRSLRLVNFL